MEMESRYDQIPTELHVDILKHLPVKSLLRFKSVRKQWCTLISSSDFGKLHLNQSLDSKSNLLLILRTMYCLNSIELDNPGLPTAVHITPRTPNFVHCTSEPPKVVGTCNGFLCTWSGGGDICLYNPSIRSGRTITCRFFADCFGFGYDSVSGDYKIFTMKSPWPVYHLTGTDPSSAVSADTHVFSLRRNSWENGPDFRYNLVGDQKNAKFCNNSLHWLVETDAVSDMIVGFELHDESYNLLPLPDFEGRRAHDELGLGVLGGELCLQVEYRVLGKYNIDVWVMKEYGVEESWKKLFRFPYEDVLGSDKVMKASAYSKGGRKVLLEQDSSFFWHELEGKLMSASLGVSDCYAVEVCVGSLVSIDELEQGEDEKVKPEEKGLRVYR